MKRILIVSLFLVIILVLTILLEVLLATRGQKENFKNPSNEPRYFENGEEELTYVILGDSTSAGQGGDYEKGIAVSSAKYLAQTQKKKVKLINFSISGATIKDIREKQLSKALEHKADIILISAGSNDVTHLTSSNDLKTDLNEILDKLIEKNCSTKIILTGSADFGAVPRFLQPLRSIAGARTNQLNNKVFYPIIKERNLTLAPIARETGPIFRKNHSLFAKDRFHPNDQGYEIWTKVINKSLEDIKYQPNHCKE